MLTLQAAEDALPLALVVLVGTRPVVLPAVVRHHLWEDFGIPNDELMSSRRHEPEDLIVWFSHHKDLDICA